MLNNLGIFNGTLCLLALTSTPILLDAKLAGANPTQVQVQANMSQSELNTVQQYNNVSTEIISLTSSMNQIAARLIQKNEIRSEGEYFVQYALFEKDRLALMEQHNALLKDIRKSNPNFPISPISTVRTTQNVYDNMRSEKQSDARTSIENYSLYLLQGVKDQESLATVNSKSQYVQSLLKVVNADQKFSTFFSTTSQSKDLDTVQKEVEKFNEQKKQLHSWKAVGLISLVLLSSLVIAHLLMRFNDSIMAKYMS
ncbi:MAG: hypothetical protein ACRCXZ_00495 [Patescibacteria group bacterium]